MHTDWRELDAFLRRRFPSRAAEDAIQEALFTLFCCEKRGIHVQSPAALACIVVRRRLADEARRRRIRIGARAKETTIDFPGSSPPAPPAAWSRRLAELGQTPTSVWIRILDLIEQGLRTTKGIARVLDRNPASTKEARRRLQAWLRSIPPPLARLMYM